MTWIRLDDGIADHPKILAAGPLALVAQVRALCYCSRHLTDGYVPAAVAKTILSDLKPLRARDLLKAKLWVNGGSGYRIHDYLDFNPSRDQVVQMRKTKAEAGRQGGIAKGLADAMARARASGMPPSHPIPEEEKEDRRRLDASAPPPAALDAAAAQIARAQVMQEEELNNALKKGKALDASTLTQHDAKKQAGLRLLKRVFPDLKEPS